MIDNNQKTEGRAVETDQICICPIHTSKEIWKDVPEYEGFYQGSNKGRVRSLDRMVTYKDGRKRWCKGQLLKPGLAQGYSVVLLMKNGKNRMYRVHALVLQLFVGPCPEGMECRHFPDSARSHNCLENVQWRTPLEQAEDKKIHGTTNLGKHYCQGENHHAAKLNDRKVRQIRKLHEKGWSIIQLAERFKVNYHTIRLAILRVTWNHVI